MYKLTEFEKQKDRLYNVNSKLAMLYTVFCSKLSVIEEDCLKAVEIALNNLHKELDTKRHDKGD